MTYCWYYTHCIFTLLLVLYPLVYSPYYWYYTHLYIHPIVGIIPICIYPIIGIIPIVYSPYYWYYTHLYIHPIFGIIPICIYPIIGIIPICIFTLLLVLYPFVFSHLYNYSGNKYHTSCYNLSFIFISIAIIIFVMPSGIVFPILTIM